ncbi:hypothetical protein I8B06_001469, partial [Vibrio vulnificus]|nr:hypothetical protein [Vibrio vulnificus]
MSKLEPRKLVPELRFSEFRESEGWNQKTVKDIFSIFQGYAFSSTDSVATGVRWLKIADVDIQKMNHNSPSFLPKHYEGEYGRFLVKKNDYVMALTRPILGGKLKIARVDDVFNGALLNQRVGKLVAEENSTFVYYLIQTSQLVSDIERSIAGSEPPNLSSQQIKDIKTYIPSDEREIEKISECLSSMDDLITANTQKLESLKLHKKGLMQKLFPEEGKNVPELRFDGFNVRWEKKQFSKLFEIGSGKDHKHLANGDIPVYGSGGYMRSVNDYLYEGKSACIGRKGTINRPMFLDGKFWTVDTLFYTHSFKKCTPEFIYLLFQNINW